MVQLRKWRPLLKLDGAQPQASYRKIIEGLVTAIIGSIPQIIDAGVRLLVSLIQNLPTIITTIVGAIPQIFSSLDSRSLCSITARKCASYRVT